MFFYRLGLSFEKKKQNLDLEPLGKKSSLDSNQKESDAPQQNDMMKDQNLHTSTPPDPSDDLVELNDHPNMSPVGCVHDYSP